MIKQVLSIRKELLKGGNFKQYIRTVKPLACMILIIDHYAMFREKTGDIFESDILELLRVGENCGIYLMVSAGGFGGSELPNRLAENFRTGISLGMSDKYQYASILRVNRVTLCPKNGIAGRGLVMINDQPLEFQTALLFCETDDYTRTEKIKEACRKRNEELKTCKAAKRLPVFSEEMTYQAFFKSEEIVSSMINKMELPFGYFVETGAPASIKFKENYCYLVLGRAGSGKSNFIKLIITAAMKQRMQVTLIDEEKKELEQ